MTINFICCTITKPEERFKVIDSEIITDKNRELRTDYIEQISDQYRVNYFILDEVYLMNIEKT